MSATSQHGATAAIASKLVFILAYLCASALALKVSGSTPSGIAFYGSFRDGMVMRQAPASVCVIGTMGAGGTGAILTVNSAESYEVNALVKDAPVAEFKLWKACLKQELAGAEIGLTAVCTGCTNTTAATLSGVVFGDDWCSGGQIQAHLDARAW